MNDIKEDFLIEIVSTQNVNGEKNKEEIRFKTRGTMKNVNDQVYIIYKEYSGQTANVCTIKVQNDSCVNVIRHGAAESQLVLEKGKKHYCPYRIKEGNFVFGIFTSAVNVDYSEDKCELDLRYSLDINSNLISDNKIFINAQKIESKKENQKNEL